MGKIFITCGLPASGKSTWSKANCNGKVIVSFDAIRREMFGVKFHVPIEPFIICTGKNFAKLLMMQNKDIIIDSCAITTYIRKEWVLMAQDYLYDITVVNFNVSFEQCMNNNKLREKNEIVPDEYMYKMKDIYRIPTSEEAKAFGYKLKHIAYRPI